MAKNFETNKIFIAVPNIDSGSNKIVQCLIFDE